MSADFDPAFLKKRGLITSGFHLPYNPNLIGRARAMRKNPTKAEKLIWYRCFRRFPVRVLRQRVIDNFIVDFYCPKLKLVIEIDGAIHDQEEQKLHDEQRTQFLEYYGLRVIRFKNEEVLNNWREVCKKVKRYLAEESSE